MSSAQGLGKKAVKYILSNAAAVTTLATGGIYTTQIRQGYTAPYLLITEEAIRPQDGKSDAAGSGASTNIHSITVSVYAKTETELNALAAAVDIALNHQEGTFNGVEVDDIRFINSDTDWVIDLHFTDMDFEVWTKK